MYKSILVAVALDHGDAAKALLDRAKQLAEPGGTIRAVNVVEPIPAYVTAEIPPDLFMNQSGRAEKDMQDLLVGYESVVPEIRVGGAAAEIMAAAEEHGSDLIMIASHKPGFSTYFIGSTAARVVRHAQCSVLVSR
ncbi:universal stress protein [Haematobacter massiliensis]|uniref:Universal stress protein n=1 Tax=Haematobacter massiliensis TaxID=195105 RepID=A0A086YAX1_9RHOB|nr:universal stress protein [Haematobacter massiliensis]KFI31421.1 universal stress protein [Haematobacter massiliensis]OWJ71675.1 universal stress protein [Haematobacter massiliensis]OWJ88113.1 universal stress protein [Haematobacter massiliensis]QBJ23503.1 universal stress protein [Haematobacter massiliensis]